MTAATTTAVPGPCAAELTARIEVRSVLGLAREGLAPPPGTASPASLFAPRGVYADSTRVVVPDTGDNRVLVWRGAPDDGAEADLVLGQPDLVSERRNGGGEPGPATLYAPVAAVVVGNVLCVADSWNHRLLFWARVPDRSGAPADWGWGQPDLHSGLPNRGGTVGLRTLHWPYGLATDGRRLLVADTGNRRVLVFDELPAGPDRPPDLVLGRPDPPPEADGASFLWPHGLATDGERLLVADAGNHRVLEWDRFPEHDGQAATRALGQPDSRSTLENRGGRVGPSTLRFPYGVALTDAGPAVVDTVNHRCLLLGPDRLPVAILGQPDLVSSGENRWQPVARDSLCWPYGAHAVPGGPLAVADSGNNRVLLTEVIDARPATGR